jgi:thiol-disulfide isomerase/thioredoxin
LQEFSLGRRRLVRTAAGATLLAATGLRQAAAAGDNGLARLRETPVGRPLPPGLTFTDGEGVPTDFAAFRDKALVVNFWATWCPPCVAEMPALDRLYDQVSHEGIEVLPLSSDRGGKAQVEPFYRGAGIRRLRIWLDARGAVGRALEIRVLPTTLIIDRRGLEVGRLIGEAAWDRPEVIAAIRRLTRTPTPANHATTNA